MPRPACSNIVRFSGDSITSRPATNRSTGCLHSGRISDGVGRPLLRSIFLRDRSSSTWAAVPGPCIESCSSSGSMPLDSTFPRGCCAPPAERARSDLPWLMHSSSLWPTRVLTARRALSRCVTWENRLGSWPRSIGCCVPVDASPCSKLQHRLAHGPGPCIASTSVALQLPSGVCCRTGKRTATSQTPCRCFRPPTLW